MKVGVVGSGMVGSTTECSLVMMRAASEVVLVDINEKLARAQAEDIQHATPFVSPARVSTGQYKQLRGAGVVLLCCGAAQRPGENRRQLLQRDAAIFYEVVRRVFDAAPDTVLVVASNPVVALTFLTAKIARLPAGRSIDSARGSAQIVREATMTISVWGSHSVPSQQKQSS
jgi:L-lactate dehydrogenase